MKTLTNFLTRLIAAVATIALLGATLSSAQAAIVQVDTFDDTSELAFAVSDTDLVNDDQATFSSLTSSPAGLTFGNVANLNEGTPGVTNDLSTVAAHADAPWSVTFTLDVSTNTLGYDITRIATYTGWNSSGNIDQDYELFVSLVGDGSFNSLGSFAFDATIDAPASEASTRIILTDDVGNIGTGVDALRFDFPNLASNLTGVYREIDVFGSATIPEPASLALMTLSLIGMVSLRKRSRC